MDSLPPEDHDQPTWIRSLRALRIELEALNDALRQRSMEDAQAHADEMETHPHDGAIQGADDLVYSDAGEQ